MDIYTLDGKDYKIVDIIPINEKKYVFFGLIENPKDFCVRILEVREGKNYYIGLDSEEEFKMALKEFGKKYKDLVVLDN